MSNPKPNCLLCGRAGELLYPNLRDRLCGSPGVWTLKQCPASDCGFVWLDPMPDGTELALAYRNYYTHAAEVDGAGLVQRFYRALLAITPVGRQRKRVTAMYLDQTNPGRLLEVGCGAGQRLALLRRLGWEVEGQEIDPTAAAVARQQSGATVHLAPLESLTGTYDAVIMNHVIEHVPDPVATLRECRRLLRDGGTFVLTTPNVASFGHRRFEVQWMPLDPPRHLHIFSLVTLHQLAARAGFQHFTTTTTSARAVGLALGSGLNAPRAVWFQFFAAARLPFHPGDGEECVLQATK